MLAPAAAPVDRTTWLFTRHRRRYVARQRMSDGRSMAKAEFSAGGFVTRWTVALALVMVTFNPTSWSYVSWLLAERPSDNLPLKALAGDDVAED